MSQKKSVWWRLLKWIVVLGVAGILVVASGLVYIYMKFSADLPAIDSLNNVQFQVPLRVYTRDGKLISEFGEKRREPVRIDQVPDILKQAFLAAEDDRFYHHPGVDYQGIVRAAIHLLRTGQRGQGGSTITMQLARNFFLSNKKTYERKLNEILLALRIESELSKDKILELYLNKIYLGNRAYGIGAAARVYYGKDISELTLAEATMIAGLPKAPSRYNPIINPERALLRRDYVLRRMHELGYIDDTRYRETLALPVTARLHYSRPEVEAGYVAEMVRSRIYAIFGERAYSAGLKVYTTLDASRQMAANKALRQGLLAYEKRHGFTGPIGKVSLLTEVVQEDGNLTGDMTLADAEDDSGVIVRSSDKPEQTEDEFAPVVRQLQAFSRYGGLQVAVVLAVDEQQASLILNDSRRATLSLAESEWARERLDTDRVGDELTSLKQRLQAGDVVYVEAPAAAADADPAATVTDAEPVQVQLSQLPGVEGALVSLDPENGDILALVGGFDFHRSKFNRVTQARRQPGSNFKPFIYSAALDNGDTAATIYNDTPVVFHDSALEGEWRPENYSGRFFGPTRLREALVKSRNLVSIRVLKRLGLRRSLDYVERFGFDISKLPADLSLALGSGAVTPLQLVTGYSVFANQGFLVAPRYISRIVDTYEEPLFVAPRFTLCDADCEQSQMETAQAQEHMDAQASGMSVDLGVVEADLAALPEPAGNSADATSELVFQPVEQGEVFAPRVLDERNAYIMSSILREVIQRGTGRKAKVLERKDLAGKTGTTNDQHDAWFSGFNSQIAASVWLGYDELQPLGSRETGGQAALPMWIDYMREALIDVEEDDLYQPAGLVTVRVDRKTGELTTGRNADSLFEVFRSEYAPGNFARSDDEAKKAENVRDTTRRKARVVEESLF